MLKNLLFIVSILTTFISVIHSAYAQVAVDVNAANAATLQSIKGVNSVKAEAIVRERDTHGPYQDMADLAARVKGLGQKSVAKLQQQGLAIGTAVKSPITVKSNIVGKSRPADKK